MKTTKITIEIILKADRYFDFEMQKELQKILTNIQKRPTTYSVSAYLESAKIDEQ